MNRIFTLHHLLRKFEELSPNVIGRSKLRPLIRAERKLIRSLGHCNFLPLETVQLHVRVRHRLATTCKFYSGRLSKMLILLQCSLADPIRYLPCKSGMFLDFLVGKATYLLLYLLLLYIQ